MGFLAVSSKIFHVHIYMGPFRSIYMSYKYKHKNLFSHWADQFRKFKIWCCRLTNVTKQLRCLVFHTMCGLQNVHFLWSSRTVSCFVCKDWNFSSDTSGKGQYFSLRPCQFSWNLHGPFTTLTSFYLHVVQCTCVLSVTLWPLEPGNSSLRDGIVSYHVMSSNVTGAGRDIGAF